MVLQAIKYKRGKLEILDQLKLPYQEDFVIIHTPQDAWDAIKTMKVRGAPAIAIVAALSVAIWAHHEFQDSITATRRSEEEKLQILETHLNYLVTSRPTAVNLADAVRKLKQVMRESKGDVVDEFISAAEQMLVADVNDNKAIGEHGARWIAQRSAHVGIPLSIITHCNTGSLATAGYGTALGIIRSLFGRDNAFKRVYYTETRPYNQGSRLTGYELIHDGIPCTLITDSMAATLMRLKRDSENIAAVVVGADRVVANGDTANKIGTYSLAVLARHHGIKFVVAAPRTTVDLNTKTGDDIVIEERDQVEVTRIKGPVVHNGMVDPEKVEQISTAAAKTEAWNPSFDVTPAELIDAIVTELGVVEKNADGRFDMENFLESQGSR